MGSNACWGQEELRISSSGPLGRFWRFHGRMASERFKFRWLNKSDGKTSKEMCGTVKRSSVFICMDLSKLHYILSSEQLGKTAGVPEPSISKPIKENTQPTQYFWWFLMSLTSLQGLESFQRFGKTGIMAIRLLLISGEKVPPPPPQQHHLFKGLTRFYD